MLPQCATNRRTAGGRVLKVFSSISVMTEITALTVGGVKPSDYVKPGSSALGNALSRLSEEYFSRLIGHGRAGVEFGALFIGADGGRTRLDGLEPSLEMRKIFQPLPLRLVGNYPWIARHVGDGIGAGDELPVGQPRIQHAIETIALLDVTIDGIGNFFGCVSREMMVLSGHRAEPAH